MTPKEAMKVFDTYASNQPMPENSYRAIIGNILDSGIEATIEAIIYANYRNGYEQE